MEWVFIVVLMLGVPAGLGIWLIVRAVQSARRIDELSRRLGELELAIYRLKETRTARAPESETKPAPAARPVPAETLQRPVAPVSPEPKPVAVPPPLAPAAPVLTPQPPPISIHPAPVQVPPSLAAGSAKPSPAPSRPAMPQINWEQFMGVKLFAWIGGLALFLGVAFFVRYSFEHNLVPPELRVALGFLTGLGLLVGGVFLHRRKQYVIGAQALCATGVLILYAVTFACRSVYKFEFFGLIPTFLLMALITTTAFLLAVRLNALVVAILGMLGGFLTPILLSTGVDNPFGLFGYIAILDAGLLVVALNRRWHFLTALAAVGTALMQIGWADEFFEANQYFLGNKILVALGVLLGFNLLYLAAAWWAKRRAQTNWWLTGAKLGLAAVALAFTAWFLDFPSLAQRPWLVFGFVFLIDLSVAALVWLDKSINLAQSLAGLAVFGLLALWTSHSLTNELLPPALVFYLGFAVIHAAFPLLLQKRSGSTATLWAGKLFPPLALLLVLIPIFKLAELSFLVWPFVFLVDLLAIVLAVMTASLLPVLAVMVLTLAATGALIFKIPATLTGLPTSFVLIGVFAVFFVAVSVWAVRKLKPAAFARGIKLNDDFGQPENLAALLPAFSAALPFLLLIMATQRLPLANPAPVFGLALLLVVLLLGLTKMFSFDWLSAVALACVTALECTWHFNRFDPANATLPLVWYLIFLAVFTVFPLVFLKSFADKVVPWATAALAGIPQFLLVHRLVGAAWPNDKMGLLPAAFAIPPLVSLVLVLKRIPAASPARLTQLACFGGVALFFVTLIFPIQFENQWLTLGWALEGAALLWLFHRVPHPGLRLTGVGLLIAAFVRLALNPEVLNYHVRTATPLLNWYLYAYGVGAACLFAGARLLAPPRNLVLKSNVPPILVGLGTVLLFLLMNIEIADFFTAVGARVRFEFGGNFGREMTYTISWALFAFVLLVIGIAKRQKAARYSALGLLSVTLLKLFFHDLAHLNQLYRIGAFIGVAVVAILASFAYQRFYAVGLKEKESKDESAQ
jgi:hypothetical protein